MVDESNETIAERLREVDRQLEEPEKQEQHEGKQHIISGRS